METVGNRIWCTNEIWKHTNYNVPTKTKKSKMTLVVLSNVNCNWWVESLSYESLHRLCDTIKTKKRLEDVRAFKCTKLSLQSVSCSVVDILS